MIKVEVAFARPDKQVLLEVSVLPNSTIEDAIVASNIMAEFPEIDLSDCAVGVFSKRAKLTDRLQDRDRVEIYRPLIIDPKEARRAKVKAKRRGAKR